MSYCCPDCGSEVVINGRCFVLPVAVRVVD